MREMRIFIPLKLASESNQRQHWSKGYARHKRQKEVIRWELLSYRIPKELPVTIILIRLSPRKFDDDNLISAFKYVRDAIADYFIEGKAPGRADDSSEMRWLYGHEKSKPVGIQVIFRWNVPNFMQDDHHLEPLPLFLRCNPGALRGEDSSSELPHKAYFPSRDDKLSKKKPKRSKSPEEACS